MSRTEIDQRIVKARAALITAHPFFGALALHLRPVATTRYPRLATDGRHLFYNLQFLDTVTGEELKGIIAHEVYHCALKHHTRRNGRDPREWNEAADLVINPMVLRAGLKLPSWVLLDPQYEGLSAEEVYRLRWQQHRLAQDQEEEHSQPGRENDQPPDDDRNGSDRRESAGGDESDSAVPDAGSGDNGASGNDEPQADLATDTADLNDGSSSSSDERDHTHQSDGVSSRDDSTTGGEDGTGSDGDGELAEFPGNEPSDGRADLADWSSRPGDHEHQDEGYCGDDSGEGPSQSNDPNGCGEILDAAPATDVGSLAEQEAEWDVRVRQAVNVAAKAAGTVPGFLAPIVEQNKEPTHDWRAQLRRFIDPSHRTDYSWSRPSRRFLSARLLLPGFVPDGVHHLAWIVDTSGSIDMDALARAGIEAQAALDEGAVDRITVVYCDAAVQHVDSFVAGDLIEFEPVGRGGTKFGPAFAWLQENKPDISAAVYVTDLEVSIGDFGDEPPFPVLWAVHGDPRVLRGRMASVPFGECIEIAD
jgi:predicted metal-dependent peptidase